MRHMRYCQIVKRRHGYDAMLLEKETFYQQQQKNDVQQEQLQHEQELAYQEQLQHKQHLAYEQQMQQARAKAYHDAYIQDLKNRGYKIRYKKSLKDYIRGIVSILVVVLVLFLLC